MRFRLVVDGEAHEVEVEGEPARLTVRVDGAPYRTRTARDGAELTVRIGARRHRIRIRGRQVTVDGLLHEVATVVIDVADRRSLGTEGSRSAGVLEVRPPMPGRIVKLAVVTGDRVRRGQTVAVLEAMKMQNEIPAPMDGVIKSIGVREGESIPADRVIVVLETR